MYKEDKYASKNENEIVCHYSWQRNVVLSSNFKVVLVLFYTLYMVY